MRIAVDIGFGFIKAMSEHGNKTSFPSVISKRGETSLKGIVGGADDDYSIIYWEDGISGRENEKKCYVGDAGITNGGNRKWEDKSDFNEDDMKVFIATAVGLLNPSNEIVDLCVGLPMSYYMQKKDELVKVLESLNAKISYAGINGIREVKFKSIFVFPQGAGAYYSAVFECNGEIKDYNLASSSVGVIDIGYRTVDYLVMGKGRKGINIIDNLSGSLEEDGMHRAFQQIENNISEKVGREIGLIEVEKALLWFGGKLDYRRESYNLIEYEEQAYKERAEQISSKIKIKWGVDGDLLDIILITGGGGESLYPILKEKFEQSELQKEPAFANCKGYLGAQARKMKSGR